MPQLRVWHIGDCVSSSRTSPAPWRPRTPSRQSARTVSAPTRPAPTSAATRKRGCVRYPRTARTSGAHRSSRMHRERRAHRPVRQRMECPVPASLADGRRPEGHDTSLAVAAVELDMAIQADQLRRRPASQTAPSARHQAAVVLADASCWRRPPPHSNPGRTTIERTRRPLVDRGNQPAHECGRPDP